MQSACVRSSIWKKFCLFKKGWFREWRRRIVHAYVVRFGQEILWKHKIFAIMGAEHLRRKEDLRLVAGLTTNMIANMRKGKHISMETLLRICGALECDIIDVISLEKDE